MNETFANFKKAVEAGKHQFELDVVKKKAKYTSKDMAEIKDSTWNLYNRIRWISIWS